MQQQLPVCPDVRAAHPGTGTVQRSGEASLVNCTGVLASKGLPGFIDALLDSEEYQQNFGDETVPYQRRRILPQRTQGELPFARMPRYGEDYRQQLEQLGYFQAQVKTYIWEWQKPPYPKAARLAGKVITITGAVLLAGGTIAVALAAWGLIAL